MLCRCASSPALLFALLLSLPAPVLADSQAEQAQGLSAAAAQRLHHRTHHHRARPEAHYVATAGTLDLFGQDGNRNAKIFYTAYTLKGATADKRPLTFAFNGGPGAASVYLHLGVAGPKIAAFANRDGANAQLTDNPDTWLPFTDLVFVDPIGTGWSRTAKADDAKNYLRRAAGRAGAGESYRALRRQQQPHCRRRNTFSARAMAASAP